MCHGGQGSGLDMYVFVPTTTTGVLWVPSQNVTIFPVRSFQLGCTQAPLLSE